MQKTGGSCSGADDVLEAIVHGDSRVLHGGCGVRDYEVIDVGTVDGWQAELSTSEIGEAVFAAKGDVLGDERLRTCADEAATKFGTCADTVVSGNGPPMLSLSLMRTWV